MHQDTQTNRTVLLNSELDLEMTERTNISQVLESPVESRSSVFTATSFWASYAQGRWKQKKRNLTGVHLETKYKGLAKHEEGDEEQGDETDTNNKIQQLNRKLLGHFRDLAAKNEDTDQVDLQFLDEISRAWSVDVMKFFLDRGSDHLCSDQFGVTPLHVAAALDYEDMVQFLLDQNADPGAHTFLDRQTPLHYAAKNDAVGSIKLLLQAGAAISCTDYKNRTPLQLAANMERSEAAQVLLEHGAGADGKDSDGQLCITALIGRMSHVAQMALGQFHVTDRITRQQYFYLNLLEPEAHSPEENLQGAVITEPTSPLQVVVQEGKLDLIMNPVFLKLIQVKWQLCGRLGAWLLLILNLLLNVSWTAVAISLSAHQESPDRYVFPQDWWRIFLVILALLLTLKEVWREVEDVLRSKRKLRLQQHWMERRLHDDLQCSHPMWPQERQFLLDETKRVHRMRGSYSQDMWNIFDWLVYTLLTVSFSFHMVDVFHPSASLHTLSRRLFAISIIFLWLRLMKHVRAFRLMGPFIVMLGNIVGDVMCFLFLYAELFIPYACSFWIIFGGSSSVPSMLSVSDLLYSLYRITLVDEYEYAAMVMVDEVMAPLLCGTFLAASSILCVNLLIALLTDTFQRVHDNSQANAVMQQAAVILQVEESMPHLRCFYDALYISKHCSPLADASDDITANPRYHQDIGHIKAQIKETLDQFLVLQRDTEAIRSSKVQKEEDKQNQVPQNRDPYRQELHAIRADLKELQTLVQQLVQDRTNLVSSSKSRLD
ncbi:transient receptor potential cation channel subfamily A member 1 isoform X2 [Kryptolebias marmoratus]|uniref:transient receptor potential cation channel subfamily A member 1 isoform X2 n=1 Tax=Kryptolebias marmoratus TaxID=37003 RepID=UPI0007F8E6C5|nr:transient receptor potential cation channel subfamily A member 1 isoform X2 [Kryptolebias marmoratus]